MADSERGEKDIFLKALEIEAEEERREFIATACGGDADKQERVETLFKHPLEFLEELWAGQESLEARLFKEHEIPWDDLAFTVVRKVLRRYYKDSLKGGFPFYMDDIMPDAIKP